MRGATPTDPHRTEIVEEQIESDPQPQQSDELRIDSAARDQQMR
jgi:hypothetical protein